MAPGAAGGRAAVSGGSFTMLDGTVVWMSHRSDTPPLQLFGTVDRRRIINRLAVAMVKEMLPTALIVDYEAMTAALPPECAPSAHALRHRAGAALSAAAAAAAGRVRSYCIDGEHWGCPHVAWNGRFREPYQCRALGNIAFANVLANLICDAA